MRAHVPLGQFIFARRQGTGGWPGLRLYGAGGNLGPELVGSWAAASAVKHAWGRRCGVDLAGGHALAPKRAFEAVQARGSDSNILAMLWPFWASSNTRALGSGTRPAFESCASRCASPPHRRTCAMNSRSTIRRQASRLGRSAQLPFHASALIQSGEQAVAVVELHRLAVLRSGRG